MLDSESIRQFVDDLGADINAFGDVGSSPLHVAAYYGFAQCCAVLLQAGVDCNNLTF